MQQIDKTVIDRAVRNVYRPFLANPDAANMRSLGDLYDELLKQPEPEAARIASALELYVSGSLNVFNHRTNVELSNRLFCFDIKQLGKQLNISPQQMKYVTHTEAGEGLIFYGNVVLPFVDRFPKDTELYRVMTTKPEEVGEA